MYFKCSMGIYSFFAIPECALLCTSSTSIICFFSILLISDLCAHLSMQSIAWKAAVCLVIDTYLSNRIIYLQMKLFAVPIGASVTILGHLGYANPDMTRILIFGDIPGSDVILLSDRDKRISCCPY